RYKLEPRHLLEVPQIQRHERKIVTHAKRRDPRVVRRGMGWPLLSHSAPWSAPQSSASPRGASSHARPVGTCPKKLDRFEVEDCASLRGPGFLVHYEGESAAVAIAP